MPNFLVVGCVNDPESFFCQFLCKRILKLDETLSLEFDVCLEVDYSRKLKKLTQMYGGGLYTHKGSHLVLQDGQYIGDIVALIQYATEKYEIADAEVANTQAFERSATEETERLYRESGRKLVFIEFGESFGASYDKLIIELYSDLCPLAAENFIDLCNGEKGRVPGGGPNLHYLGCPVHRIVPGGWIQCGDIFDGSGGHSIAANEEGKVQDECFSVDFSAPDGGILGYSSSAPHSNGSQFFITLGPCEWMQNSFVGFGRVIQGLSTLKAIENIPTSNQKPKVRVVVKSCGVEFHG